jgi:tRNA modification GTPase
MPAHSGKVVVNTMLVTDTIAAISTAPGIGGIGIIRISGNNAFEITSRLFKGKKNFKNLKSHTINYGKIIDPESGDAVDEVLVSKMEKPNTFTREDVVEINCHGGTMVLRRILELVLKEGARLAEPGEFTKRAFLNGRIDLSQAEAVIDLINSKTDESSKAALNQLEGKLSGKIREARNELIELIAHIEVTVDYPEYDIEEVTGQQINRELKKIRQKLINITEGFKRGRIIREGIDAVIIGKPNVGKSSLLNELTGKNKAIVTEIPGTTRDIIEEYININGIPVKVIDTAGIRETEDAVEKIGVERAKNAIKTADLVIMMIDASEGMREEDIKILDRLKDKKIILIINKIDLVDAAGKLPVPKGVKDNTRIVRTSLTHDIGIEDLENEIKELFLKGEISPNAEVVLTNVRHKDLIDKAINSIDDACRAHESGMPLDFITIDLKNGAEYLGRITGESVSEDVISEIFRKFCVGK